MAYPDRLEHRTRSIVVVFDGGRENWHSSTWEIGFGPLITEKREEKKENMRKGNHGFGGIPPSLLSSDKSTMLWKFEWCPFHCGVGGFCYARATGSRCFYSKSEWAPRFPFLFGTVLPLFVRRIVSKEKIHSWTCFSSSSHMQKRSEYNAHEGKKGGKPPAKNRWTKKGERLSLEKTLFGKCFLRSSVGGVKR